MAPKLKKKVDFVTKLIYRQPPGRGHGKAIEHRNERGTRDQRIDYAARLVYRYAT